MLTLVIQVLATVSQAVVCSSVFVALLERTTEVLVF